MPEYATLDAEEIRAILGLIPLPTEGGYYAETYQSPLMLHGLPAYRDARHASTAIYYMLTPDTCSAMHRLASDEVYHFYLGDPVELLLLSEDGAGHIARLGTNLRAGERPQLVVPARVWQGSRLAPQGRYALLGTTVAPGFAYADYEHGNTDELARRYPAFAAEIRTRV